VSASLFSNKRNVNVWEVVGKLKRLENEFWIVYGDRMFKCSVLNFSFTLCVYYHEIFFENWR